MAQKEQHSYQRTAKIRAVKVKHLKGFGTDKERHVKKTHWEVRCDIHGRISRDGRKFMSVAPPKSRFERVFQGCPICYHGGSYETKL